MLPLLWTQMSLDQKSRVTALSISRRRAAADARPTNSPGQADAGHGRLWGSCFTGQPTDDPAVYRLPEAQSDFIFCDRGTAGTAGHGAGVGPLWRCWCGAGMAIAAETREPFGRLLAAGVAAMLPSQVLIHIGMNVGLLPITGLSLPLVSHGGSGLLGHAVALGLLLNVGLRPGYEVANEPFRYG